VGGDQPRELALPHHPPAPGQHGSRQRLATEGWSEVRRSVLPACPGERRFWERLGYAFEKERLDQDKRASWVLRKSLIRY
jgi:hypothetical protein